MPLPPVPSLSRKRILVICPRRIGDVLLATPLARSIKAAWPDAVVDFLVLSGTQGVLEGNPDIHETIAFAQHAGFADKARQFRRIWRRYDLALSVIPTDRARFYAWAAAPRRLGFISAREDTWHKKMWLDHSQQYHPQPWQHTVNLALQLATQLGIEAVSQVVLPGLADGEGEKLMVRAGLAGPYAILHPCPKFRYKMWNVDSWVALIARLRDSGLTVALTGGKDADELAYIGRITAQAGPGCITLAGRLSLAETAELLRRARLFVGPDTAVTHLAAAAGIPTIALFGPSNPVTWGPWPAGRQADASPWALRGSGRSGNVWLIQGEGDCVPCQREGCDRKLDSASRCLEEISVERVLQAAREALDEPLLTR